MLEQIENDLEKSIITTNILTSNFKFIDQLSKRSYSFNDNKYIPFYYYLGKYIKPQSILEVGIDLGFISSCFLKSCKTVEYYFGFQPKNDILWDEKLYKSNVKKNYKNNIETHYGKLLDKKFLEIIEEKKFDLAIINTKDNYDDLFTICDLIFINLNNNGYFVMDFIKQDKNKKIFFNIANGYKKEYKVFDTRYGTGVIKK